MNEAPGLVLSVLGTQYSVFSIQYLFWKWWSDYLVYTLDRTFGRYLRESRAQYFTQGRKDQSRVERLNCVGFWASKEPGPPESSVVTLAHKSRPAVSTHLR